MPGSGTRSSPGPTRPAALVARLVERFERREDAEVDRIARVVSLVTHDGCQVNALVGYFGERRSEPCGHCSFCRSGRPQQLPARPSTPPLDAAVERGSLDAIAAAHPDALALPRQRARFLCGITSPATTRARLTRDPLFGAAADRRFDEVLAWCTP